MVKAVSPADQEMEQLSSAITSALEDTLMEEDSDVRALMALRVFSAIAVMYGWIPPLGTNPESGNTVKNSSTTAP
jgi:hypothetical protein